MKTIIAIFIAVLVSFPAYAHAKKKTQKKQTVTYEQLKTYYHRMCGNDEDIEMYIGTTEERVKYWCRKIAGIMYKRGDLPNSGNAKRRGYKKRVYKKRYKKRYKRRAKKK